MSDTERQFIKDVAKIIKQAEKEVKHITKNTSLTNCIKGDVILYQRNAAYNDIKTQLKKYIKQQKQI